jgi:hypothetical protein
VAIKPSGFPVLKKKGIESALAERHVAHATNATRASQNLVPIKLSLSKAEIDWSASATIRDI